LIAIGAIVGVVGIFIVLAGICVGYKLGQRKQLATAARTPAAPSVSVCVEAEPVVVELVDSNPHIKRTSKGNLLVI
jgi:hypothetical protein